MKVSNDGSPGARWDKKLSLTGGVRGGEGGIGMLVEQAITEVVRSAR